MIYVKAIPAFSDNYIWLIHTGHNNDCFVVDPGDADAVKQYLEQHGFVLKGILITHHHWDHTGGVEALVAANSVPVYGPHSVNIPCVTRAVKENDRISLLGGQLTVFETPGHTLDHIAYFGLGDDGPPLLFCGDTLFSAGCGRLFEGTAEQMQASMNKLKALPLETAVYCTHEYTAANLRFAQTVEPRNTDIQRYAQSVNKLRLLDSITLPSSIELELRVNPYLRTSHPDVISAAESRCTEKTQSDTEVLRVIRQWKDDFQ